VRDILCSADPSKTWENWMLNDTAPAVADCALPTLDKIMALAQKLNADGTPTMIFGSGVVHKGYLPKVALEKELNTPKVR
jgi:thiol:disulfide interchange protein DsbC